MIGWDNKTATGWYRGTLLHSRSLSARDLKTCPTANFVVKYKKVDTDKALDGTVACELSERLYGAEVWWVLLEKEYRLRCTVQTNALLAVSF